MKSKRYIYLLCLLIVGLSACRDEEDDGTSMLSFSRSIYILQPTGLLEVELRAGSVVTERTVVPFTVGGSAVKGEDYELPVEEFVLEPGADRAKVQILPKANYTKGREIRLELQPVDGFNLSGKKVAIIPVEAKERIILTFVKNWQELEDQLILKIEVSGAETGRFNSTTELCVPFVIKETSTAVAGEHYAIEGDVHEFVIPAGKDRAEIKVDFLALEAGHDRIEMALALPNESFFFGNYNEMIIPIVGPLSMNKLGGKWAYEAFQSKDFLEMLVGSDFPDDLVALPMNNSSTDVLEFVVENGVNKMKVHATGDLKNYFRDCDLAIGTTYEDYLWEVDMSGLVTAVDLGEVNLNFSSNQSKLVPIRIAMRLLNGGKTLEVRVLEYEPIEFLFNVYEMFEGDMSMFPLVFHFTRVEE